MPLDFDHNLKQVHDLALDGVYYGMTCLAGRNWRVGAVIPDWQAKLTTLGNLGERDYYDFQELGIWLGQAQSIGKIAVMCCGLGSSWPGMARELYLYFPACRKAMDQIASYANWDLLGMMDEQTMDKISLTRWQIPYLFMLEYAQWRQFQSLGLRPDVVCGHSLGELIALCVAGIYDARSAWQLFEIRAQHMAELEAKSGKQGGMLAVPAPDEEIAEVMAQWPDLRISNRNTPSQFVISGQREQLLQARRYLRRKHIPAVMLNMDLAFHNPAMRIARDLSVLRLNGLNMDKPRNSVMLSCVTGLPYPTEQPAICEAIADLDENAVDWVNLTGNIVDTYGVSTFLELGPQATLCGITSELYPKALCIPSDRRNHEAEALREACARLYASGFLDPDKIREEISKRRPDCGRLAYAAAVATPATRPTDTLADIAPQDQELIIQIIAEASGKSIQDIRPELDLRHDLGLRSATFPFVMMESEQRLGRSVRLENLFELVTVADLIRFLTGAGKLPDFPPKQEIRMDFLASRRGLHRYRVEGQALIPAPFNTKAAGMGKSASVLTLIEDDAVQSRLLAGLAARGYEIGLPESVEPKAEWQEWGATIWRYGNGAAADCCKNIDGLVLALPACPPANFQAPQGWLSDLDAIVKRYLHAGKQPWIIILQRFVNDAQDWHARILGWLTESANSLCQRFSDFRAIAWLAPEIPSQNSECGDLLVWEIEHGQGKRIIWDGLPGQGQVPLICPASECYDLAMPDPKPPFAADGSAFLGLAQFSLFRNKDFATHGANAFYSPHRRAPVAPWLPLNAILEVMASWANLRAPWLQIVGFQDLHVIDFPELLSGITRECRIAAIPRQELMLEKVMTRLCAVNMEVAALTTNGRKDGSWLPLASCEFLQCRKIPDLRRHWLSTQELASTPVSSAPLYDALGFGPEWQILEEIELLQLQNGTGLHACLRLKDAGGVYQLVEATMLAALGAIALHCATSAAAVASYLAPWHFAGIGFARFIPIVRKPSDLDLRLYPAWRSERLLRYNARIQSASGKPVLIVHNLELECPYLANERK